MSVYACSLAAQWEGGGENTQEIRDLLITLSPTLTPSLFLSLSSLGLPFSASLFIEGCRGLHFWLTGMLQTSLKTSFQSQCSVKTT